MKVTSKTSVSFPKIGWAISAGEVKELPSNKDDAARIMQEPNITVVDEKAVGETKK